MRPAKSLLLASAVLAAATLGARAEVKVVASVKPVHALVAAVMEGVGKPGLIVEGAGSPHTYSLKPSQARMLQSADVVFWIGHELESFLEKPLETIASGATSVELIDAPGLTRLRFRQGGAFEKHGHEGEAEADHDHDHDKAAEADHDHEHHHGEFDSHVWLDPVNAKAMVAAIRDALARADPANAARYRANAEAVAARLDTLVTEVSADLEPVKGKGFIVFHDAYRYFETRFGVPASGSITVSPEVLPGARRIGEIREKVRDLGAACVFAEPQFEPKLVATVIEGTRAKSGVLDPLGASLKAGPDLYFELIRTLAASLKTCLSEAS